MDGRRGRLAAALTAVFICALGVAGPARAATFASEPAPYVEPSAGPLTWTFAATTPGAPVAWRLSTDAAWHRCTTDGSASFAGLPEGRYTLLVADDTDACAAKDTAAPATHVVPSREVVIDGTPPVVPAPTAVRQPTGDVAIETPATDALSGIASYAWTAGDGTAPQSTARGRFLHLYAPGHHTGSVTVVDRAGNQATQAFTVDVPAAVPVVTPDVAPPTVGITKVGPRALGAHALPVVLGVSERATLTVTASVRAGGRTYRLPVTRRTLTSHRILVVRIPVASGVRRAIARALRAHRPVRARVQVVAVDPAGNRRVVSAGARLTG